MFFMVLTLYKRRQRGRRTRRWAVRPANRDREEGGYYVKVFRTIKDIDPELLFSNTRMMPDMYMLLLNLLKPSLQSKKRRISCDERLSVTLSHLAHGVPIQHLALCFKLGRSTVREIILETCEIIWATLSSVYCSEPTESQYSTIAKDFYDLWNMPLCCGAIDGKHIAIKCPNKSGSMFFNYKKHFSIVLMAACDAKYTFTAVNIGSYGSENDAGVFRTSQFGKNLLNDTLPLPPAAPLPNSRSPEVFNHFFVGDGAFPLRKNLMRPYPGANLGKEKTIFNYRLSRARRVIENAFGILTSRWRILRTTMQWDPDNATKITLACIGLHNFLMLNDQSKSYCNDQYVDGETQDHMVRSGQWRNESQNILRSVTTFMRRGQTEAFAIRDRLVQYFVEEGALDFQENMIQ